jgi:holo-[acyl-carrier protein] synthase
MIFGIGTDILSHDRVKRVWGRFGDRFASRLLMDDEYALFERTPNKVRFLAMRFAAKEAIAKAMGTGFAHGIWIRDIGTVPNAWGQPQVVFSARGDLMRRRLGIGAGFLSLTDEAGLIVAVAVLMREAPAGDAR